MSDRLPCPACGSHPYTWGPAGEPQRRCWKCDHVYPPAATLPPAARGSSAGPPPVNGPGWTPGRASPRAAVITPRGLYFDGQLYVVDPTDSLALIRAAYRCERRQLWLGPETAAALGMPAKFAVPDAVEGERYRYGMPHPWLDRLVRDGWVPSTSPAGLAPWLTLNHGEIWIDLCIPAWDGSNPFYPVERPQHLLDALNLFATLLGVRYRRSPGTTGLALMRAVHAGPGGLTLPDAHLAPPALHEGELGTREHWIRASAIPGKGWVHCWDLNGMYLAACSSAELGFGEPVAGVPLRPQGGWAPGYYLASVRVDRKPRMPLPFPTGTAPQWYTAPSLDLALELGFRLNVREAWVYPESHRWLEPWYARLRDARKALMAEIPTPAVKLASTAVKLLYAHSLGRLAGSWLQAGDATFRPDWRDAVIARARANMYRHLVRVQLGSGAMPVAALIDAVAYASELEDPAQAAAQLGLQVDPQLGKWKLAGSLSAAQARKLVRAQASPQRAVMALMAAFGEAAA